MHIYVCRYVGIRCICIIYGAETARAINLRFDVPVYDYVFFFAPGVKMMNIYTAAYLLDIIGFLGHP